MGTVPKQIIDQARDNANPAAPPRGDILLLSGDPNRLQKLIGEISREIESLETKPSLTFKERKQLQKARIKYNLYLRAQAYALKKAKKTNVLSTLFSQAYGRPDVASSKIWATPFAHQFTYSPKVLKENEMLSAGPNFGILGFHLTPGTAGVKSFFKSVTGQIKPASGETK